MRVGALATAIGSFTSAPGRVWRLTAGASLLLPLGFVGLMSIGLPLLLAGGLALAASSRALADRGHWDAAVALGLSAVGAVAFVGPLDGLF